jgi:hypothetical protein
MKRLKSRIHRRWHRHVPVRTQRRLATALRAGSYVATALVAVFLLLLIAGHVLLPRVAARKIDVESYLSAASTPTGTVCTRDCAPRA